MEFIKYEFIPIGAVDLVTFFFRRIFTIIKIGGFQSLISTNTIAQGGSRIFGLDIILEQGGIINFAVQRIRWPGLANVDVSLITIHNGAYYGKKFLNNAIENNISSFLDSAEKTYQVNELVTNKNRMYKGVTLLGDGFIIDKKEYQNIISQNPKNLDVILPYLNGYDLNDDFEVNPKNYCISFMIGN